MVVLVVDSNKEERVRLKKRLSGFCQVFTLSSLTEAIAFSKSQAVDIVMLSVQHDSVGDDSLFAGAQYLSERAVLTFAVTEDNCTPKDDAYIHRGFSGVLRKPIVFTELMDHLYPYV